MLLRVRVSKQNPLLENKFQNQKKLPRNFEIRLSFLFVGRRILVENVPDP